MDKKEKKRDYAFRISKESLIAFSKLSAEEKLNWLEEANKFIEDLVPEEKLMRWEKFINKRK